MTVGELQEKLRGIDPKTHIVVNHEADCEVDFFEILGAALAKGDPRRQEATGKAGFKFDDAGPATWFFIAIGEA